MAGVAGERERERRREGEKRVIGVVGWRERNEVSSKHRPKLLLRVRTSSKHQVVEERSRRGGFQALISTEKAIDMELDVKHG